MKQSHKLIACGTSVFIAAVLGLQAQTSGTSGTSGNTGATTSQPPSGASQSSSQFGSSSSNMQSSAPSSTTPPSTGMSGSASANGSASSSFNSSTNPSMTPPSSSTTPNSSYSNNNYSSTNPSNTASTTSTSQYGAQANSQNTQTSTQVNAGVASTVTNEQVTTFVQQLDTQGPAVVQQVSTQVGDLACSQDTAQNLVEALHSGQSVQITSNVNGQQQSATFNANGTHLGYGEAYLAVALAAQELRNAGVSSCATPEQWQAALLGGPLNVSTTSTTTNASAAAGSTTQFPGIVTLHTQGQGWGEIAQSNNLQLGQIITSNAANQPTGFSSSQMNQGRVDANTPAPDDNDNHKGEKKHHWWSLHKDKDKDTNADQNSTNNSTPDQNATGNTTTPSTR